MFFKNLIPPFLYDLLLLLFNRKIIFIGPFSCWKDASDKSVGYGSNKILSQVFKSSMRVKNGEAEYERDGINFYEQDYNWELLTTIVSLQNSKGLNEKVIIYDFGGSLGSTYYRNKKYFEYVCLNFIWNIIEQKSYYDLGIRYFESENLKFHHSLDQVKNNFSADLIILGSVIQFVENPIKLIETLTSLKTHFIYIDRLFYSTEITKPEIFIQKVPQSINAGSYPCWIFPPFYLEKLFKDLGYTCISKFKCSDKLDNITSNGCIFVKEK
jgi:putative methyltransferase (TIGR04325 family)